MNNRYATSLFLYRNWILVFPAQKLAKLEHSKQNLSNASKKTSEIQNINIWNVFGPTLRILSIKLDNFGSILLWNDPFGAKCHMFQSPVWGEGAGEGKNAFGHRIGLIAHKPTFQQTCQWSVNSSLYITVIWRRKKLCSMCLGLIVMAL